MNMPLGQGIHGEQFRDICTGNEKTSRHRPGNCLIFITGKCRSYTEALAGRDNRMNRKLKVVWSWESVSYDYFKTLGVKMVMGRDFDPGFRRDVVNWETRECAYIINESGLREMGIDNPLGKSFSVWGFKGPIVGVVEDYHSRSMHSEMRPMFYILNPVFWNEIVIRLIPARKSILKKSKRSGTSLVTITHLR